MNIKKTLLILFIAIPFCSFTAHKFYISLTQITYKSESKSVQIIINVFMDDIETALNKDFNIDLKLTSKNELKNNDVYFEKYLNEKLIFKIDDVPYKFNYIGKEYDADLVFFFLEIENVNTFTSLQITNSILTNHFPEQQNLIKIKVDKKIKES